MKVSNFLNVHFLPTCYTCCISQTPGKTYKKSWVCLGHTMFNFWIILFMSLVPMIACKEDGPARMRIRLGNDNPVVVFMMNDINQYYTTRGEGTVQTILAPEAYIIEPTGTKYEISVHVTTGSTSRECTSTILERPWLNDQEKYEKLEGPNCIGIFF
ncbi:multicystatin-like isoform X1 [Biomphalaria glabrata]|nr:multicystatin-like isoform X1 [Biomphalaria glabrata]